MTRSQGPSTRWSLILRAQGAGPDRRVALGELLSFYEGFVLSLLRRYRHPPDLTPDELKQEFFTSMLDNDDVDKLERERGSFRGWLNVAVRRFVANEWSKWHAAKSGRRITVLTTPDVVDGLDLGSEEIDDACMREYARNLIVYALELQRREARDRTRFDLLARFVPGPQLEIVEYGPFARTLGTTANALARRICEMRGRYGELVRLAIRDLNDWEGDCEAAIDAELAQLRSYLFS